MLFKVSALIALLTFAALAPSAAGTTGVMSGYVRDNSGRPVVDARVTVASPSERRATLTDRTGFFVFLTLPPDVYSVTAQKSGAPDANAFGARISSDQTTFLAFRLSRLLGCSGGAPVTVASERRSTQVNSVNTQMVDAYPPKTAPPIFLTPISQSRHLMCL